jgi:hypothetical protein
VRCSAFRGGFPPPLVTPAPYGAGKTVTIRGAIREIRGAIREKRGCVLCLIPPPRSGGGIGPTSRLALDQARGAGFLASRRVGAWVFAEAVPPFYLSPEVLGERDSLTWKFVPGGG